MRQISFQAAVGPYLSLYLSLSLSLLLIFSIFWSCGQQWPQNVLVIALYFPFSYLSVSFLPLSVSFCLYVFLYLCPLFSFWLTVSITPFRLLVFLLISLCVSVYLSTVYLVPSVFLCLYLLIYPLLYFSLSLDIFLLVCHLFFCLFLHSVSSCLSEFLCLPICLPTETLSLPVLFLTSCLCFFSCIFVPFYLVLSLRLCMTLPDSQSLLASLSFPCLSLLSLPLFLYFFCFSFPFKFPHNPPPPQLYFVSGQDRMHDVKNRLIFNG